MDLGSQSSKVFSMRAVSRSHLIGGRAGTAVPCPYNETNFSAPQPGCISNYNLAVCRIEIGSGPSDALVVGCKGLPGLLTDCDGVFGDGSLRRSFRLQI